MSYYRNILILSCCLACFKTVSAEWIKVDSGTLAHLRSVHFVDRNEGWIAGSRGTLLKTLDGGRTWHGNKSFTSDNIRDVYFSDQDKGWLLCESSLYMGSRSSQSYLLRTLDSGKTWQRIDFVGATDRVVRLFFTKDGKGFAVGEGGGIWQGQGDISNWRRMKLPLRFLMLDGTFVDEYRGVLVGGGGTILYTVDGGSEWRPASLATNVRTRLNSIFFIDQKKGWVAGAGGRIFVTGDGGRVWVEQRSGTVDDFFDLFFLTQEKGFAIGDKGLIAETTNGGTTWVRVVSGLASPLERITFNGKRVFIVGYGGTILTNQPNR